jgi:dipeptidyl aminopeptidase/acylaminoacyl peptidase
MRFIAAPALAVLLAASAALAAPESRPTSADLVKLRTASGLALSPDGARVAFVCATAAFDSAAARADGDTKAGWSSERQLCVAEVATRAVRQLTQGDAGASSPCWAPDGRSIAFVRKGGLYVLPVDGGEPAKLATGEVEPGSPAYSPDGKWIAFLGEARLADDEKRARWARGGAVHWEHEFPVTKLWLVPAAGGEPRAVSGARNTVSFAWSRDSRSLAAVTSESADPYVVSNLVTVTLFGAADGAVVRELARPPGTYESLAWSPDGRYLALTSLEGGLSNLNALLLWSATDGSLRNLAPDTNRTFAGLAWSADSKSVLAVVRARTAMAIERFPLAGKPSALPFAGRVITTTPVTDAAAKRLTFLSATDRSPEDVTVFDPATGKTAVVTALNPEVAAWPLGETRVVKWTNGSGQEIEGVLTLAAGAKSGAPAPLIVMPHGGPDDVSSTRFSPLVQYFASRGYSTLRPNYRGSLGYGFAFYAANRDHFGEVEQADIESGVDRLVHDGLADAGKLYIGGWSWGGYICTWMIGHVQRCGLGRHALVLAQRHQPRRRRAVGIPGRPVAADRALRPGEPHPLRDAGEDPAAAHPRPGRQPGAVRRKRPVLPRAQGPGTRGRVLGLPAREPRVRRGRPPSGLREALGRLVRRALTGRTGGRARPRGLARPGPRPVTFRPLTPSGVPSPCRPGLSFFSHEENLCAFVSGCCRSS